MSQFAEESGGEYFLGQTYTMEDFRRLEADMAPVLSWITKNIAPFLEDSKKGERQLEEELKLYTSSEYNSSLNVNCQYKRWLINFRADYFSDEKAFWLCVSTQIKFKRKFSFTLNPKTFGFHELIQDRSFLPNFTKAFLSSKSLDELNARPRRTYRVFIPAVNDKFMAYASDLSLGEQLANDRVVRECLLNMELKKKGDLAIGTTNLHPWRDSNPTVTLSEPVFKSDAKQLHQYLLCFKAFLDAMERLDIIE